MVATGIVRYLEWAALAYGHDLVLPRGVAAQRVVTGAAATGPDEPRAQTATVATAAAPDTDTVAAPDGAADARTAAAGDVVAALAALRGEVAGCTRCRLHEGRQHTVFGEGDAAARVMFVGEAPGATEDRTGRPFVGDVGQLLDRILAGAMGLQRRDVYIANVNKCRPPANREPEPDEVAACLPYLHQQVALVRPEVIVCLGRVAAQNLLGTPESASKLRGRTLDYHGIPVVVTWHPAYLLREPSRKREAWDDIKRVNRLLGLPEVPEPQAR